MSYSAVIGVCKQAFMQRGTGSPTSCRSGYEERKNYSAFGRERLGRYGQRLNAIEMYAVACSSGGRLYRTRKAGSIIWRALRVPGVTLGTGSENDSRPRVGKAADRPGSGVVQRLLYDDIQIQFPDALLTKVDVASMAASPGGSPEPFLGPRLLELAWSLPDKNDSNGANAKLCSRS